MTKTKFIKLPTPGTYTGPTIWINPAFVGYVHEIFPTSGAKSSDTLCSTVTLVPPQFYPDPAMDEGFTQLMLAEPENHVAQGVIARETGLLSVKPSMVVALFAHKFNQLSIIRLLPTHPTVATWGNLQEFNAKGVPTYIAEALGIELFEPKEKAIA
jgi:hypothetical protein